MAFVEYCVFISCTMYQQVNFIVIEYTLKDVI